MASQSPKSTNENVSHSIVKSFRIYKIIISLIISGTLQCTRAEDEHKENTIPTITSICVLHNTCNNVSIYQ